MNSISKLNVRETLAEVLVEKSPHADIQEYVNVLSNLAVMAARDRLFVNADYAASVLLDALISKI